MKCVYCRTEKPSDQFNKEHVIPPAFGGAVKDLGDFVCIECNSEFNRQFEQDFLRGPGFESFNRALRGLKGRNSYPVWADGSYKNFRIYEQVALHFPRVGVIVYKDKVYTPHQLIVETGKNDFLYAYRLPDDVFESNFKMFDVLLSRIKIESTIIAIYFWAQNTETTVAEDSKLKADFHYWLGKNGILGGAYKCDVYVSGAIHIRTDIEARNRMFGKMCLNFLFWLMDNRDMCLLPNFDRLREYVRFGRKESDLVRVWNGQYNPFLSNMEHSSPDASMGVFTYKNHLFGSIYLPISGIYLLDIGDASDVLTHRDRNGIAGVDGEVVCFTFSKNGEDLWYFPVRAGCKDLSKKITSHGEFKRLFPDH